MFATIGYMFSMVGGGGVVVLVEEGKVAASDETQRGVDRRVRNTEH